MARDLFINGESMVAVKGNVNTAIANLTNLGLAEEAIRISLDFKHLEVQVDAWGGEIPAEIQFKLSAATIIMNLVHFDRDVLDVCLRESMGGVATVGLLPRAGTRMGNAAARFAANNHFIGLNITSPVAGKPWRFYFAYLANPPMEFPLGVERSVTTLTWRAIPYPGGSTPGDPWQGGVGSLNTPLWDHIADT